MHIKIQCTCQKYNLCTPNILPFDNLSRFNQFIHYIKLCIYGLYSLYKML